MKCHMSSVALVIKIKLLLRGVKESISYLSEAADISVSKKVK